MQGIALSVDHPFIPRRLLIYCTQLQKGKGNPYSIAQLRVPVLIPVLGSQPAGDVSHKPGGKKVKVKVVHTRLSSVGLRS